VTYTCWEFKKSQNLRESFTFITISMARSAVYSIAILFVTIGISSMQTLISFSHGRCVKINDIYHFATFHIYTDIFNLNTSLQFARMNQTNKDAIESRLKMSFIRYYTTVYYHRIREHQPSRMMRINENSKDMFFLTTSNKRNSSKLRK
jgi:hypothetical protein